MPRLQLIIHLSKIQMSNRISQGFSLIELLIAMTILAILLSIAYPSYQGQMIKSRRSDGQIKLMEIMHAQERFFTENNTYTADLTNLGYASASDVESDEGFYKITATGCGGGISICVLLTAVPQGPQSTDADLTIDSTGAKTPPEKW